VLRVNQFESKHKSMSVLVRKQSTGELLIFVKGSPELMLRLSITKCHGVPELVKQLSLEGHRTIAYGYKIISEDQLEDYLSCQR
jgi:magnesium-transporting ATPase (P-type)